MLFNAPLSAWRADRLIDLLDLPEAASVVEVGCGRGEFLRRLTARWSCTALGVDVDPEAIAAARSAAEQASVPVEYRCADAKLLPLSGVDLAVCIGATHAYGTGAAAWHNTLRVFSRLVRPGGQILIGEGFWERTPDPEYLAFLGDNPGIEKTHHENITSAEEAGLIPLYAAVSSRDEWDHFEWSHRLRIEREAAARPDDEALKARLARSRRWREGYLRWGRSTMGFGFYLLGVPAA